MGRILFLIWAILLPAHALAAPLRLAVASSALPAARALSDAFTAATGVPVSIAHGASGKIYAQIGQGAPFDIFLSADADRPEALMQDGLGHARKTYAIGRLALVGPEGGTPGEDPSATLRGQRVALADPDVAPYGAAAVEVLAAWGLGLDDIEPLQAENVGQVALWLATGNADRGFLAASLLPELLARRDMSVWMVPEDLHAPIRQDALWLAASAGSDVAAAFWDWLDGEAARTILAARGFGVPAR